MFNFSMWRIFNSHKQASLFLLLLSPWQETTAECNRILKKLSNIPDSNDSYQPTLYLTKQTVF